MAKILESNLLFFFESYGDTRVIPSSELHSPIRLILFCGLRVKATVMKQQGFQTAEYAKEFDQITRGEYTPDNIRAFALRLIESRSGKDKLTREQIDFAINAGANSAHKIFKPLAATMIQKQFTILESMLFAINWKANRKDGIEWRKSTESALARDKELVRLNDSIASTRLALERYRKEAKQRQRQASECLASINESKRKIYELEKERNEQSRE